MKSTFFSLIKNIVFLWFNSTLVNRSFILSILKWRKTTPCWGFKTQAAAELVRAVIFHQTRTKQKCAFTLSHQFTRRVALHVSLKNIQKSNKHHKTSLCLTFISVKRCKLNIYKTVKSVVKLTSIKTKTDNTHKKGVAHILLVEHLVFL